MERTKTQIYYTSEANVCDSGIGAMYVINTNTLV